MLVYGLDLWFNPYAAVVLWLSILVLLLLLLSNSFWENKRFLFDRYCLHLFVSNCDKQAVLCSMFVLLTSNCFVHFVPLIWSTSCTFFFSAFVNFILLISRQYYYVFMLFPWLVLTIIFL